MSDLGLSLSLSNVGPSQLMWAHSHVMWAEIGDDLRSGAR